MRMRTLGMGIAVAVVLAGAWVAQALAAEAAAVFRFAPADGMTLLAESKVTQSVEVQGRAVPPRTSSYREKQSVRRTEKGYEIRSLVLDAATSGGVADVDPVIRALKGKTLVLTVDRDGKLLAVEGTEAVAQDMRKGLPAGAPESVTKLISAEVFADAVKTEWAANVTDYIGRPLAVSTAWVSVEELQIPDGRKAKYYVAKKVAGLTTAAGRRLVRVQARCDSDPAKLKSFLGAAAEKALAGLKPFPREVHISGETSMLLDPETMHATESTWTRRAAFTMKIPEGDFPITFTQTRQTKDVVAK